MHRFIICTIAISLFSVSIKAQHRIRFQLRTSQPEVLLAEAGDDITYTGLDISIGGNPSVLGGLSPYEFQWLPSLGLDDATSPNPVLYGYDAQVYVLSIVDARGCVSQDSVDTYIQSFDELKVDEFVSVFPNPNSGHFELQLKSKNTSLSTSVEVTTLLGQLIATIPWPNTAIPLHVDASDWALGKYVLTMTLAERKINRMILISNK
jgi:hypothetical protein